MPKELFENVSFTLAVEVSLELVKCTDYLHCPVACKNLAHCHLFNSAA